MNDFMGSFYSRQKVGNDLADNHTQHHILIFEMLSVLC